MKQETCMATRTHRTQVPYKGSGKKIILPLLVIICLGGIPAFPQEPPSDTPDNPPVGSDTRNYFMQQNEENTPIIFQTLEWAPGNHIKWYEVLLEMMDEATGQWVPVNDAIPETMPGTGNLPQNLPEFKGDGRYKTTSNKFTVSLKARESGSPQPYRYTVTSYNLLGHRAFTTNYIEFEVKKAYIPGVESISQDLIYLDTLYDPTIRVSGHNLRKETDYYLVNDREVIRPVEIIPNDNQRRAEVVFDPRSLDVGEWLFRAENPGAFTSDIPLTIKFMKWYDVSLSAGYAPLFVPYDDNVSTYFGTNFMPLGVDLRATFIFLKRRAGYLGVSMNGKWNNFNGEFDAHNVNTHFMQSLLTVVYRYPIIRNRLTVEARLGGGLSYVTGLKFQFPHALESEPFSSIFPAATAGISLAGYAWRGLFIEAGADLIVSFTPDMLILSISPTVSVGWTL